MNEASALPELEGPRFDAQAIKAAIVQDDRRFGIALGAVFLIHALFFVSFNQTSSSTLRRLGDTGGVDEAISVAIITEADLRSRATVDDRAKGAPTPPMPQAQPTPVAPPPQPPTPPPEPPVEAQSKPPVEPVPAPKEPVLTEPARPGEGLKKQVQEPPPKTAKPTEQAKPEETKAQQKQEKQEPRPQQKTRTASLDLTPPPQVFTAPFGGGGAGIERPPGITRSGENDAFARGVIRALQRTMPQLSNTRGRVTVRITLDKNGSLVGTEVLRPSSVAGLDQNVVFATKQSSFPFPPRNAIPPDLIFVVTYIYR